MKLSLTQSLLLLGAAVLLALLVHAWWSVRRAAPRQGEAAEPEQRVEPSLGGADAVGEATEAVDVPATPAPEVLRPPVSARRVMRLDALVDAIVPLALEAPVAGELALAHLPHSWRAGSKPMHIEGLNRDTDAWELPQAEQVYTEFQAGVQLANRKGPLNEIEYSEFVQKVQTFAEAVGAMADFPDMLEVVARARELDDFANPLDAQIGLNLRARDASWSVSFVQQCAAAHGFVPGALPGRLVIPGAEEGAPPVLVLDFDPQAALADAPQATALRELVLSLDVAQTPEAAEPFPAWYRVGTELAQSLGADAVDDAGMPVALGAYDAIARQLGELYRSLESRDLAAGSPAARRLFSG